MVVIGGCVLDIQAAPSTSADVRPGGSVPGSVKQLPGGVGRNIAEAATKLLAGSGREALLISVVGRDAAGDSLLASCSQLGCVEAGTLAPAGPGCARAAAVGAGLARLQHHHCCCASA